MNEHEQLLPVEARIALQNCFAQIRLARATELARSGRLLEAEAALLDKDNLPKNTCDLDLLARIAARQGRFEEARHRWKAALQIEPGNETYRLCIQGLTPGTRIVRLIANSLDTKLNVIVWAIIILAIATLVYAFCF